MAVALAALLLLTTSTAATEIVFIDAVEAAVLLPESVFDCPASNCYDGDESALESDNCVEDSVAPDPNLCQTDETEVSVMQETDVIAAFARYKAVFGAQAEPPTDRTPTPEQLSEARYIFNAGRIYLD